MTSYEETHPYWVGSLSTAIAITLSRIEPKDARRDLKRTLDAFLRSSVPSEELKGMLREEMKK